MLAVPKNETNEFLKLLSSLSMKLIDDAFRERIYAAKTLEEVYEAFSA